MQCFAYICEATTPIEVETRVTPRNAILPLCSPLYSPTEARDLLALLSLLHF